MKPGTEPGGAHPAEAKRSLSDRISAELFYDLSATATGIGSGKLLSRRSYHAMITKDPIGKTTTIPGCLTCAPQQSGYTYGLGIVSSGNWLL